jgi:hypothetical protein
MSEMNPMKENEEEEEEGMISDPLQTAKEELQGGGTDEDRDLSEEQGQRDVEENIEAELDDRLQSHGEDRL